MKNFLYKILKMLLGIFAIFQMGKKIGKLSLKEKINSKTIKNVKKCQKINNKVNNMSESNLDKLLLK
jgi:hypothetical protein